MMTIASAIISSLNILLHLVAEYLLFCWCKNKKGMKTQTIYLINLSMTEIVICIFMLMEDALDLVEDYTLYYKHPKTKSESAVDIQHFDELLYIAMYFMFTIYLCNLYLITADRLATTVLQARYMIYCNVRNAKRIVALLWIVTLFLGSGICLTWEFINLIMILSLPRACYQPWNSVFCCSAVEPTVLLTIDMHKDDDVS